MRQSIKNFKRQMNKVFNQNFVFKLIRNKLQPKQSKKNDDRHETNSAPRQHPTAQRNE